MVIRLEGLVVVVVDVAICRIIIVVNSGMFVIWASGSCCCREFGRSNVVVGHAARRTCAGAAFQPQLRSTLILNIRCCRHCSPYSPKSITGEFGIASWRDPKMPTAVGEICDKRVRTGCEPNNFTSTLGLMRYVSMSMQFDP